MTGVSDQMQGIDWSLYFIIYLKIPWQETHLYHVSVRDNWHPHKENIELPQVQLPEEFNVVSVKTKNCSAYVRNVC